MTFFRGSAMRNSSVRSVLLLAGFMLGAGCSGLMPVASSSSFGIPVDGRAEASYDVTPDFTGQLPGLFRASTMAHGVAWMGANLSTLEFGLVDSFDSGSGTVFGLAFGDGIDTKHFLEVSYEYTEEHTNEDAGATASHSKFYFGKRNYLVASDKTDATTAPYISSGLTFHVFSSDTEVTGLPGGDIKYASGLGVYVATGVEYPVGSGSWAFCCDVRASVVALDATPENSGINSTFGAAVMLLSHF